jgi:hypothetical protein
MKWPTKFEPPKPQGISYLEREKVGDREGRGKQAGQQPGRFKVRLGLEGRDIEIERHRNKEI